MKRREDYLTAIRRPVCTQLASASLSKIFLRFISRCCKHSRLGNTILFAMLIQLNSSVSSTQHAAINDTFGSRPKIIETSFSCSLANPFAPRRDSLAFVGCCCGYFSPYVLIVRIGIRRHQSFHIDFIVSGPTLSVSPLLRLIPPSYSFQPSFKFCANLFKIGQPELWSILCDVAQMFVLEEEVQDPFCLLTYVPLLAHSPTTYTSLGSALRAVWRPIQVLFTRSVRPQTS